MQRIIDAAEKLAAQTGGRFIIDKRKVRDFNRRIAKSAPAAGAPKTTVDGTTQ